MPFPFLNLPRDQAVQRSGAGVVGGHRQGCFHGFPRGIQLALLVRGFGHLQGIVQLLRAHHGGADSLAQLLQIGVVPVQSQRSIYILLRFVELFASHCVLRTFTKFTHLFADFIALDTLLHLAQQPVGPGVLLVDFQHAYKRTLCLVDLSPIEEKLHFVHLAVDQFLF